MSPEAGGISQYKPLRVTQLTWSSPRTNRLLLEAGVGTSYYGWGNFERYTGSNGWRASVSSVTGAHSLKFGDQEQWTMGRPCRRPTTRATASSRRRIRGRPMAAARIISGLLDVNPSLAGRIDNLLTDSRGQGEAGRGSSRSPS